MTACPSVWALPGGERVRCEWPAGHQHELGAREAYREQHSGYTRGRRRVTWLPD